MWCSLSKMLVIFFHSSTRDWIGNTKQSIRALFNGNMQILSGYDMFKNPANSNMNLLSITYPESVFILDSTARCRITILVRQVPISRVVPEKQNVNIVSPYQWYHVGLQYSDINSRSVYYYYSIQILYLIIFNKSYCNQVNEW